MFFVRGWVEFIVIVIGVWSLEPIGISILGSMLSSVKPKEKK